MFFANLLYQKKESPFWRVAPRADVQNGVLGWIFVMAEFVVYGIRPTIKATCQIIQRNCASGL